MNTLNAEIVDDVRRVARKVGRRELSRSEYVQHGRFSLYQIYDGGHTWEQYCKAAGVATRRKEPVPEEVYFSRLKGAVETLGRFPKVSERKRFGLNFSKRRYPTLKVFIDRAAQLGIVVSPNQQVGRTVTCDEASPAMDTWHESTQATPARDHPVPPIPGRTGRKKWERTGVGGFPYAPQDELGVAALFAVLCAQGKLAGHEWEILELRGGKGIDATCYDHAEHKEIRVELKHRLSKAGWNHKVEDLDYVVCWENRWPDFPKPVIVLRNMLSVRDS